MIKRRNSNVINDFSGGQDTRTPILNMTLTKSPNMRNYHCAGIKERLIKRGGFSKVNSSAVTTDNLDVFYPSGYQTFDHALRDTATNTQIAQGFKPKTSSTVTKVRLWLKKTGIPAGTDTVTLTIQTDSAGLPSGTPVTNGTSIAVDCSDTLTTSYAWVTFTFSVNPSLSAGTQYHLVLSGAFTIDASHYVSWGADNYDVIYPDGSMSLNGGASWAAELAYDACFEVYITGATGGQVGSALFDFSSKNMLIGAFGSTLYKMDKSSAGTPDGTWDSLGALTSSRFLSFADWQSGRALINSDIGLYTYTGTGSVSVVSAAPVGKFFIIWKNYAFMAGVRGSPNGIRYSEISDYTSWPVGNALSTQFNTNDGDVITGIRILKGKLYVFKRYSVHRITYLGSNPAFQVDQILGMGSPSHYTIKEVDLGGDIGSVLIFLTTDRKLAIFDGYNVQVINENLTEETNDLFGGADDQPISFADINYTYADLFHAVVKNDTSEYILYCVLGSDTSVNYAFVFDYKTGGIYPYDGQIFASSLFATSVNKAKKLYCAGYTGYMWEMESGNSDDGSAINGYWTSGKIRPENSRLLNKLLVAAVHLKEVSSEATLNLNIQYRLDWNTSWTTAEVVNYNRANDFTFGKTALLDIGTIENMFQIKVKDNSTQAASTIYGVDLHGESLGLSVGDGATE